MAQAQQATIKAITSRADAADTFLFVLAKRAAALEARLAQMEADPQDTDENPEYAATESQLSVALGGFVATRAETLAGLQAKAKRVLAFRNWDDEPQVDADV